MAERYVGLMASCMIAMENLIGGKLLDPQTLEEDYRQIDKDALEDIDLQVGLATILRRGQAYMDRLERRACLSPVLTRSLLRATIVVQEVILLGNARRTDILCLDTPDPVPVTTIITTTEMRDNNPRVSSNNKQVDQMPWLCTLTMSRPMTSLKS